MLISSKITIISDVYDPGSRHTIYEHDHVSSRLAGGLRGAWVNSADLAPASTYSGKNIGRIPRRIPAA